MDAHLLGTLKQFQWLSETVTLIKAGGTGNGLGASWAKWQEA